MPSQSTLTLNTKAYAPRGKSGDIATWALAGDTTFGGATSTVTESVRGPSKDGVTRIRFKLDVPKAASENSSCACIGQNIGTGIATVNWSSRVALPPPRGPTLLIGSKVLLPMRSSPLLATTWREAGNSFPLNFHLHKGVNHGIRKKILSLVALYI